MTILKTPENTVTIPTGVSVTPKGYVYLNTSSKWVARADGNGMLSTHKKECIGVHVSPGTDWKTDRRMYANANYYRIFEIKTDENAGKDEKTGRPLPVYPSRSDNISVGLKAAIKKAAENCGLDAVLAESFEEDADTILDLAMYMISEESAVFQHYPHWARNHAFFSGSIRSDSFISGFEKDKITLSQINLFKKKWAVKSLGDGRVFVCYDSTNENSSAKGVFIVEKGHAKDDPGINQVNTEYAVRQKDGMPITFRNFPGSINDMAEAPEMIAFFEELLKDEEVKKAVTIIVIADRGYVSEENIKGFRNAGIGCILMLKKNMNMTVSLVDSNAGQVKRLENYLPSSGRFAMTVKRKMFNDDEKDSWFHIVWDPSLEEADRNELAKEIEGERRRIEKDIERKTLRNKDELKRLSKFFRLEFHEEGTLDVGARGNARTVPAYAIDGFERNEEEIERHHARCGFMVFMTTREMTAVETMEALSKRDCVEKAFRALKGWLGMDSIGVRYESSMHTKSLVWFVASILRSVIFNETKRLRKNDRKRYTVPAMTRLLDEITADKDLETGKYKRRYRLTKSQRVVAECLGVTEAEIDKIIAEL